MVIAYPTRHARSTETTVHGPVSQPKISTPLSTMAISPDHVHYFGYKRSICLTRYWDTATTSTADEITIDVVTGLTPLAERDNLSAFPTIFPCGTGKHIHPQRDDKISLNTWIKL